MAPLESGFATSHNSSQQRQERSHRTHIDERQHESGLFRLQTGPQMKCDLSAIQRRVTRNPVAWGTVTEYVPCLSEWVFVDVVMCASQLSSPGACNLSYACRSGFSANSLPNLTPVIHPRGSLKSVPQARNPRPWLLCRSPSETQ